MNLPIVRVLVDRLVGWLIVLCVMLAAIPVLVVVVVSAAAGLFPTKPLRIQAILPHRD